MARVINGLLTSPMNAHSLGRGDVVMVGTDEAGYAALTVADNREMPAAPDARWIEFQGVDETQGNRFGMPFAKNQPLDRVVGARSTAGGSHS